MFEVRGKADHLAWYRTDEAPADVVFLHGFSDSSLCWEPLIGAMPGIRALAIDARGHGESGLPEEPFGYDAHRNDVALVLSSQPRDGGYVVIGHSMGAMTAAHLAASRPDLVRAVVLEDPPTGELPQASWSEPAWLADLRTLDVPTRISRGRADNPNWPTDELAPWAISKGQVNPRMFDLPFHGPSPLTDLLAGMTCPTLLIHGDPNRGSLISPTYANHCAEAAAGDFHAAHIPQAGHSIHRDKRPEYLTELTTFLARHSAATGL